MPMTRPTALSIALWMALPLSAHAAADSAPDAREFDRVQVTATRTERAISDVAATVDAIKVWDAVAKVPAPRPKAASPGIRWPDDA